jgi:hypothetical protein
VGAAFAATDCKLPDGEADAARPSNPETPELPIGAQELPWYLKVPPGGV